MNSKQKLMFVGGGYCPKNGIDRRRRANSYAEEPVHIEPSLFAKSTYRNCVLSGTITELSLAKSATSGHLVKCSSCSSFIRVNT